MRDEKRRKAASRGRLTFFAALKRQQWLLNLHFYESCHVCNTCLNPSQSRLLLFWDQRLLMEFDLGWKPPARRDRFMPISHRVNYGFHTHCTQRGGGGGSGRWGGWGDFCTWHMIPASCKENDYLSKRLLAETSASRLCLFIFFLIQVTTLEIIPHIYSATGIQRRHFVHSKKISYFVQIVSISVKTGTADKGAVQLPCNKRKNKQWINK